MNNYRIIESSLSEIPMVSVAMVTYNHQDFIGEAIESVLMQETTFNVELVIAEDYSTDKTREIVLDYQSRFPDQIKVILQNRNIGAQKNNIALLSNLKGKYVAALEGDDYWTDPLKLQKQVDFLEDNLSYIACGCYVDIERLGTLEKNSHDLKNVSLNKTQLFFEWPFATLSTLFRNINLDTFIKFNNGGDLELFLYLSKFGDFMRLDFVGGVYRYHGSGANSGSDYYTNSLQHINTKLVANKNYNLKEDLQVKRMLNHYIKKELIKIKYLLVGKYEIKKSFKLVQHCLKMYGRI